MAQVNTLQCSGSTGEGFGRAHSNVIFKQLLAPAKALLILQHWKAPNELLVISANSMHSFCGHCTCQGFRSSRVLFMYTTAELSENAAADQRDC